MRSRTIIAIILTSLTVNRLQAEVTNATPTLVDDPVIAVQAILPMGWEILRVVEHTYPSYRPNGDGKAIFLSSPRQGKGETKPGYEAVLYIMPGDYDDGGEDPTRGQAQSYPARLIATTDKAKIYFWGTIGPTSAMGWNTIKEDILRVILKK